MIVERLRAAGSWELAIAPDTPRTVRDRIDLASAGFGQLLILDAWADPALGASTLRSLARYSGVYRYRRDDVLSGPGLCAILGDEDGKGPILDTAVTLSAATLSTALAAILPANGISTGTVTNTGTNVTGTFQYVDVRSALDQICDSTGAEWRVNPALTVDAAAPGTLWTSYTTPSAIVTRRSSGRGGAVFGVEPATLEVEHSLDEYTTKVHYIARGNGDPTVSTATASSVPYKAPGSASDLRMERVIDSTQTDTANASGLATAQLARFSSLQRGLRLGSYEYDLPARVRPGDRLYVYDPEADLYDTAVQVVRGGDVVFPLSVRVYSLTWPVRRQMGVYLLTPSNPPVVVDLTPYVVWESGETTIEVGVQPRPVGSDIATSVPSPFGDLPLISVLPGSYTPTLTASVSNPTLGTGSTATGTYSIDASGMVDVSFLVQFGSSGTAAGSGTYRISLPVTAAADGYPCGTVQVANAGIAAWFRTAVVYGSGTYFEMYNDDEVAVTHAAPVAWAASDFLRGALRYRRA